MVNLSPHNRISPSDSSEVRRYHRHSPKWSSRDGRPSEAAVCTALTMITYEGIGTLPVQIPTTNRSKHTAGYQQALERFQSIGPYRHRRRAISDYCNVEPRPRDGG